MRAEVQVDLDTFAAIQLRLKAALAVLRHRLHKDHLSREEFDAVSNALEAWDGTSRGPDKSKGATK